MFFFGCALLPVLSWLTYPSSPVLATCSDNPVQSCAGSPCAGSPVLAVCYPGSLVLLALICLSCPASPVFPCPVLSVQFCLFCSACPVLPVCSACPVQVFLSFWSCPWRGDSRRPAAPPPPLPPLRRGCTAMVTASYNWTGGHTPPHLLASPSPGSTGGEHAD